MINEKKDGTPLLPGEFTSAFARMSISQTSAWPPKAAFGWGREEKFVKS